MSAALAVIYALIGFVVAGAAFADEIDRGEAGEHSFVLFLLFVALWPAVLATHIGALIGRPEP